MANDPQTFSELKLSLINRVGRDDLEETNILNEVIAEVERRFQRDVFLPEREATTTLSASAATVALPADFMGARTVYVDGAADTPLKRVTATRLHELYATAATGTPRHFAVEGENMLLGPVPASTTSIKMTYVQKFTPLSEAATTNYLLTDHPDLYIHACLAELHDFNRDPVADREHTKTREIINQINSSTRRRLTNSGPLKANSPVAQVNRYARA